MLTEIQVDILKYLSNGLKPKQIAQMLYLTIYGFNYHKKQICNKMNANTIVEAVAIAKDKGII